jgi:hypothetical protein
LKYSISSLVISNFLLIYRTYSGQDYRIQNESHQLLYQR